MVLILNLFAALLCWTASFAHAAPPTCRARRDTRCSSGGSSTTPLTRTAITPVWDSRAWMRQQTFTGTPALHEHYFVINPPGNAPSPGNIRFVWNDGGNGSGQSVELQPNIDWVRFTAALTHVDGREVASFDIHFGLVYEGQENSYIWTNGHNQYVAGEAQDQGHYTWRAPSRRGFFRTPSTRPVITEEFGLYETGILLNIHNAGSARIKLKYTLTWTFRS